MCASGWSVWCGVRELCSGVVFSVVCAAGDDGRPRGLKIEDQGDGRRPQQQSPVPARSAGWRRPAAEATTVSAGEDGLGHRSQRSTEVHCDSQH